MVILEFGEAEKMLIVGFGVAEKLLKFNDDASFCQRFNILLVVLSTKDKRLILE